MYFHPTPLHRNPRKISNFFCNFKIPARAATFGRPGGRRRGAASRSPGAATRTLYFSLYKTQISSRTARKTRPHCFRVPVVSVPRKIRSPCLLSRDDEYFPRFSEKGEGGEGEGEGEGGRGGGTLLCRFFLALYVREIS